MSGRIVPAYDGPYKMDYEDAVEVVNAYEFIFGSDRVTGAIRSLLADVDDGRAWQEFYKDRYDKLYAETTKVDEVKDNEDE